MAVNIRTSDKWFSKCIRQRAGWCCERCGASFGGPSQGLHCSHYHGRGKWGTRFDPQNCESLCYGCHSHLGGNPHLHEDRKREILGPYEYAALNERAQDAKAGRQMRREEKAIAKHYREQFEAGTCEAYL